MMKIPFFNYQALFNDHKQSLTEIFSEVSSKGAFIMQSELEEFEKSLAEYTKSNHAVGVANATDALQMLMMADGITQGDEVIFCSHTMVATASAIHFTGAKPIPVDTANDHLIELLGQKPDVVLSDMAANTTGHRQTDHIRTTHLLEIALNFSIESLNKNGVFLAKCFKGGTEKKALDLMQKNFSKVHHVKPDASRKESVEGYVIALGFKGK